MLMEDEDPALPIYGPHQQIPGQWSPYLPDGGVNPLNPGDFGIPQYLPDGSPNPDWLDFYDVEAGDVVPETGEPFGRARDRLNQPGQQGPRLDDFHVRPGGTGIPRYDKHGNPLYHHQPTFTFPEGGGGQGGGGQGGGGQGGGGQGGGGQGGGGQGGGGQGGGGQGGGGQGGGPSRFKLPRWLRGLGAVGIGGTGLGMLLTGPDAGDPGNPDGKVIEPPEQSAPQPTPYRPGY
jgi:hypothetical protein